MERRWQGAGRGGRKGDVSGVHEGATGKREANTHVSASFCKEDG